MIGKLANEIGGVTFPLKVLESRAGFYLGTEDEGLPFSRESEEYFSSRDFAERALKTGNFTQRIIS